MKTKQFSLTTIGLFLLSTLSINNAIQSQVNNTNDTLQRLSAAAARNTGLSTIILAAVGGSTGAIIGQHMDLQAGEIRLALPDAAVERVGEGIVIEFNNRILFGSDKSKLTVEAKNSLGKLNEIFKKYPDTNIEVQGHTDNTGTVKYNQALSERRASAVMGNLSENDIATARLSIKGFGESLPKYSNKTSEGHAQNRRVEFLMSANAKMKSDAATEAK